MKGSEVQVLVSTIVDARQAAGPPSADMVAGIGLGAAPAAPGLVFRADFGRRLGSGIDGLRRRWRQDTDMVVVTELVTTGWRCPASGGKAALTFLRISGHLC